MLSASSVVQQMPTVYIPRTCLYLSIGRCCGVGTAQHSRLGSGLKSSEVLTLCSRLQAAGHTMDVDPLQLMRQLSYGTISHGRASALSAELPRTSVQLLPFQNAKPKEKDVPRPQPSQTLQQCFATSNSPAMCSAPEAAQQVLLPIAGRSHASQQLR